MTDISVPLTQPTSLKRLVALLSVPAIAIFISSNVVNVGNLAFNMIFSRWMGPELFGDLALVMTIKLAILGVLGAGQMAISQLVARAEGSEGATFATALARLNRVLFVCLWVALPLVLLASVAGSVGARIGLGSPIVLLVLLGSLPFTAPLNVLRGVVFGRLDTRGVIVSANVEMAVRLVGGIIAWQMGLGIEGVVAAISLSIIAGWAVLATKLPALRAPKVPVKPVARAIAVGALPFAALQLAQILALDADIIFAKTALDDTQAGYIGALSLFQRIQFFACFALASALLPAVASAARDGKGIAGTVLPVAGLFAAVSVSVLIAAAILPELLLTLLVGEGFLAASGGLFLAALAAVAFTGSYLLATLLAALENRSGIWIAFGVCAAQFVAIGIQAYAPDAHFLDLLWIKGLTQSLLFAGLALFSANILMRRAKSTLAG